MSKGQTEQEPASQKKKPKKRGTKSIFLVPFPKIVFMYPTFLIAIVAAVGTYLGEKQPKLIATAMNWTGQTINPDPHIALHDVQVAFTLIFMYVLAINLFVLAFDFPRATSLTLFFFLAAVVLGLYLAFTLRPELLPMAKAAIRLIRPAADYLFFTCLSVVLGMIFIGVFIGVRFDYWEVRDNELLHHHGLLSDLKRYSVMHIRVDKEINDVFEYLLLGSGRFIIQPANARRPIILENVPRISRKEKQITKLLSALAVDVSQRQDSTY